MNTGSNTGNFSTPKSLRDKTLSKLPRLKRPKVLDPSCGTGEFLLSAKEYFEQPELYGWEIDERLVDIARKVIPEANIECTNALLKDFHEQFDVVIGNPPYFEFMPDAYIRGKFKEVLGGRVNIYALFVYLGIKLLKPGGYLAYVMSTSMNNGAYFAKLRQFIVREANIEYLEVLDRDFFEGVLQSTMVFIARKSANKGNYLFSKNGILIFTENPEKLRRFFERRTTLFELGYKVLTGKVVWNQNKSALTNDPHGAVPLIWSHNVTPKGLILK